MGVFSPLTGGGQEVDLGMVMFTQSWFSRVLGIKIFNRDACIFDVFCGVPSLVVFQRITDPLCLLQEFVSVKERVNDFFEFIFWLSVYLDRWRGSWDL